MNLVAVIPNPKDENKAIEINEDLIKPNSPYDSLPNNRATNIPATNGNPFPIRLPNNAQKNLLTYDSF